MTEYRSANNNIRECIVDTFSQMDEMDNMRIEGELEKQSLATGIVRFADNRDSGVADVDDETSNFTALIRRPVFNTQ